MNHKDYKIKLVISKNKNSDYFYNENISSPNYIKFIEILHKYYDLFGIKCKQTKSRIKPYTYLYICPEQNYFAKEFIDEYYISKKFTTMIHLKSIKNT